MPEIGIVDWKGDGCVLVFPLANHYKKNRNVLTEFWVYTKYKEWLPEYPQIMQVRPAKPMRLQTEDDR